MSPNSSSASRGNYRLIALILVIAIMAIGLVALEAVEHLLLPGLDFWTTHLLTVTVSTVIAAIATNIVLRRLERLYDRLHEEMDERVRAEQALAQAHAQLELRVQERTAELEHANRELGETEARLRSLLANTNAVVYTKDPDGRYVLVEGQCEPIFGVANQLLRGRMADQVFPPAVSQVLNANDRRVFDTGAASEYELAIPGANGPRTLLSTEFPLRNDGGNIYGLCGIAIDITERKRTEAELRQSEERYRTISEMVSDFCFSAHLGPQGETVIDWATDAFARITGYSLEEYNAVGGMFALVIPEDSTALHDYRTRIISGETGEFEFRIRRKDGSICWLHSLAHPSFNQNTGQVEGFFAALADVTHRRQAEQALKEAMGFLERRVAERTRELSILLQISQNVASTLDLQPLLKMVLDQFKSLVDYRGAAIIVRDATGLNILHSNEWLTAEQLGQMLGRVGQSSTHRELAARREPLIVETVGTGADGDRIMSELVDAEETGSMASIRSWMAVPLIVKDKPIGMLLLTHDEPGYYSAHRAELAVAVANHAAAAIENARLYESARRLAVVEERQRLARDLHDSVSQALYGIELGTQTAREMLGNEPSPLLEPIDYVQSLAKAALAEMRALIFDLRPEALATDGLVVGLRKQTTFLRARHRLDVQLDLMPEPNVLIDVKETLYRIAQESFHNIVKHARANRVAVCLSRMDGNLVLDVRDDGIGFDPSRAYPGHLGLASMRERVARFGGTIAVESTPGAGAHIRAEIPVQ